MSSYRLKEISLVPSGKELVDIVLSSTQRRTPTQCHKQFAIARIRKFYMRKVKFAQQTYHDVLTKIITEFPRLDDIHPFYADLFNIQYDRDHYKLALGAVNACRGTVDKLSKDYVKMLKYADSMFKCKSLKVAALGRMSTMVGKLSKELTYLEEVRQHMSRLPTINPSSRTLILCGFPNVGKSSFLNCVSQANVDVQPYAFTTKSIYVGHFDYQSTKWQVVDTPGLLDRPLSEKNTIELTSVTALTHIQAAILYFLDPSETCGYKLADQVNLFHNIRVLFRGQPIVIVVNKTDIKPLNSLNETEKQLIESMKNGVDNDISMLDCSTLNKDNVGMVRDSACSALVASLLPKKTSGNKTNAIANRLTIVTPKNGLNKSRPSVELKAPLGILPKRSSRNNGDDMDEEEESDEEEMTARELQELEGGVGVYSYNNRKDWTLENPDHVNDCIPEVYEGSNIADFIDPDILRKLEILEREEAELAAAWEAEDKSDGGYLSKQPLREELFGKIATVKEMRSVHKGQGTTPRLSRNKKSIIGVDEVRKGLDKWGYQTEGVLSRADEKETETLQNELKDDDESVESVISDEEDLTEKQYKRLMQRKVKASARLRVKGDLGDKYREEKDKSNRLSLSGLKTDKDMKKKMKTDGIVSRKRVANDTHNRQGDGDKRIHNAKPRHLYAGKRAMQSSHR